MRNILIDDGFVKCPNYMAFEFLQTFIVNKVDAEKTSIIWEMTVNIPSVMSQYWAKFHNASKSLL